MKIIQQLLVTFFTSLMMVPMPVTADLNLSNRSDSLKAAKRLDHFSDLHPSDWAYQALNNLRERHRCEVESPNGSLTRYEAAELLSQCLESTVQPNDEEQLLIDELRIELAVIKGRVDLLENNVEVFDN